MGAKRILALGSVAALCAGAAAPLFMASAASAADVTNICTNGPKTAVLAVNVGAIALGAGLCSAATGRNLLIITGPLGATGPQGAVGVSGGTGGTGGTGPVGQNGSKGDQGVVGGTGGTGTIGGPGPNGVQGPIGITGATGQGPTGTAGGLGDIGVIGPQGPSGAIGITGPTGHAIPGTIAFGCFNGIDAHPAGTCSDAATGGGDRQIYGGAGFLGNTNTWTARAPVGGGTPTGPSQIVLTCPTVFNTLTAGGADLFFTDTTFTMRGVLESSFPNPANAQQWIVSAVVTATAPGGPKATADQGGPNLLVDPYVICRNP